ncbi:MAG: UDP-N-acetylmuramoyl-tripeptide--D-alanyl-D-alanine ligase [Gammaproteobacteria bacterium]|nr:UDP-N-acetylmuramoyl-tripeptide--D-alanyl-D-alanine ligase [Gammaproteobacteria bacterium]MDE2346386.1 UDP-N-acetylmuramoyl-tripeptide--D-alanyl-D-alanine ligase [Gammaproteobacteria bacterium]
MNKRRLSDVAAVTGGKLVGQDAEFLRVSTDTRRIEAGDLFVALHGPNFNGHDFVLQAEKLGAKGALVEHPILSHLPQVVVRDSRKALGAYAAHWRAQFSIPVIGITGSNGKTTVKEMITSIMRRRRVTLATRGNMNNDIGVPLTLLELEDKYRAAVIEMGTNHPGEIAYLASVTSANVGVVTNAGAAHLEALGSIQGVAMEKGALYSGLRANGIAVINEDDAYAGLWHEMAGKRIQRSFGVDERADFHPRPGSVKQLSTGVWAFRLVSPAGEASIQLSLPGRHNVLNALAAAATASCAGASLDDVMSGLANTPNIGGRLNVVPGARGSRLIDDTYNANPQSLKAAMEFAISLGDPVWLVLGDMAELGENGATLHADCGELARLLGVARLFSFGSLSLHATERFGKGAQHFVNRDALVTALRSNLRQGISLLIKGSRSMHMERVVEGLRAPQVVDKTLGVD